MGRYKIGWSGQYIKYGKNLSRPRKYELFTGERILVRQIPNQLPNCINAAFIDTVAINDNNSMIIKIIDTNFSIKYILGVLNSKLISKWFAIYFGKLSRKIFPQFKINELRIFPIAKASQFVQNLIEKKVSGIMFADNDLINISLERQIDELVFKLYELTYEEVLVVCPEFWLSEEEYNLIEIE